MMQNSLEVAAVSFILMQTCLFAQTADSSNFFPHNLGDMWEYYVVEEGIFSDTLQVIVVSDSAGQDSFSYFQHHRQFINPNEPPSFGWLERFKQDSVGQIFGLAGTTRELLKYRLNALQKQLWIVEDLGAGYDIARVEKVYPDTIFGTPTVIKEIWYYATEDTSDTTIWLWQYTERLANGIGTIFRGLGDLALFYEIFLKGAIVDGVVYGDITPVGIEKPNSNAVYTRFQLHQNYPNPFNSITTIQFVLNNSTQTTLRIYDINGKEVKRLVNNQLLSTGKHKVTWNGKTKKGDNVASGVYLYQLKAGNIQLTRRMLMLQ